MCHRRGKKRLKIAAIGHFPVNYPLFSYVFVFSIFTGSLFWPYKWDSQVSTIQKIHFMNHDTILGSLLWASALPMVLCNLFSILTWSWKAKCSAFPLRSHFLRYVCGMWTAPYLPLEHLTLMASIILHPRYLSCITILSASSSFASPSCPIHL